MNLQKSRMLLAALGLGLTAGFALAAGDDTIKARQACMKAQGGGIFGEMLPMIKGEKPYDNAVVQAAFEKIGAACADWGNFWTEDAMTGSSAETWAKPEIWSDKAGFEAAGNASYQATQALKATTDEAGFKAAFGAVGAACQGCHEKFRRPKE